MEKGIMTEEAPVYLGGKDKKLWFFDEQHHKWKYQRLEEEFDYNVMNSLVAIGVGENRCPTEAQWAEFCVISAIITAFTDVITLPIPKNVSLNDLEKYSWYQLWSLFGDYPGGKTERHKRFSNEFVGALMRIFIPRQHTVDGPGRPYNQSFFITRWNNYNHYPDWFNDKVGNVRLCHLQRGKEALETFSKETQENIKLIASFIHSILKKVNIAIKE